MPWKQFRRLCSYYMDCVRCSDKEQDILFSNRLNNDFLMPTNLPYRWIENETIEILQLNRNQRPARNQIFSAANDQKEIFIGYPFSSFLSTKGNYCLSPILLFPVEVSHEAGFYQGMKLTIDRKTISLNLKWVEYNIPKEDQPAFRQACQNFENGELDVSATLAYIENYLSARYGYKINLNPDNLQYSLNHQDAQAERILNTAVVFIGSESNFTKTLLREIQQIHDETDEVLDSTALAYVFRNPPKPIPALLGDTRKIPAVFTGRPLTEHQFLSVESALNLPVTKVTGPPGTGKSFMSVNLISNEVFQGGRVLFTSKNHKAIHAIYEMCAGMVLADGIPLIEFLTYPGEDNVPSWDKKQRKIDERCNLIQGNLLHDDVDLSEEKSQKRRVDASEESPSVQAVTQGLDLYRDAEKYLQRLSFLREKIWMLQNLLVQLNEQLPANVESPDFDRRFVEIMALLEEYASPSWWERFLPRFLRLRKEHANRRAVIAELNALIPHILPRFASRETIHREIRRIKKARESRRRTSTQLENCQEQVDKIANSEGDYDHLLAELSNSSKKVSVNLKNALKESYLARTKEIPSEALIHRIKDALPNENPLPFQNHAMGLDRYERVLNEMDPLYRLFPAWAVTLLSLRKASPCIPGIFSLVVIDEASQCDIPPIIPALFRARRVAIVGDPDQFPPVISLKDKLHQHLEKKNEFVPAVPSRFSYRTSNAYAVCPTAPILLMEHFRCVDEIANYINEEFYRGKLCPCADALGRDTEVCRFPAGMRWEETKGADGDKGEMEAVLDFLKELKRREYRGSVGVISPFRSIANRMKTLVHENRKEMPEGLDVSGEDNIERVNTANGFQGGECDIILFLLGLNTDRKRGQLWYLKEAEHKWIINVSVSRAKLLFVTFGDSSEAEKTGISYIKNLKPAVRPITSAKVGPGEIILKKALNDMGLFPETQYPVCGRYLDLAFPAKKLDIEVDGQAWHLDRNGNRKADDIHRDMTLQADGWTVLRFWHHEVVNQRHLCVEKIRNALENLP